MIWLRLIAFSSIIAKKINLVFGLVLSFGKKLDKRKLPQPIYDTLDGLDKNNQLIVLSAIIINRSLPCPSY